MIRKYEVELYQRRNGSQKLQNEIKEKIMNANRQMNEILSYEAKRNQTIQEDKRNTVDYELLNTASQIAMSFGEGWDDLSFVNEMILGL